MTDSPSSSQPDAKSILLTALTEQLEGLDGYSESFGPNGDKALRASLEKTISEMDISVALDADTGQPASIFLTQSDWDKIKRMWKNPCTQAAGESAAMIFRILCVPWKKG